MLFQANTANRPAAVPRSRSAASLSAPPIAATSPPDSIHDLIERQASADPDAIALIAPERPPLPYGALALHIQQTVHALHSLGIGPATRVAAVLPPGPEAATAFLALAGAALCAPLNPGLCVDEVHRSFSSLHVDALLVQAGIDSPSRTAALARGIPIIELSPDLRTEAGKFTLTLARGSRSLPPATADASQHYALLLHTSGTTASPKVVPLTQHHLCVSAENLRQALQLSPDDCYLNVTPLYYIAAINMALGTLAAGGSIIFPPGFQAPRFFEWLQDFRPTWYNAPPTTHRAILDRAPSNRQIIRNCPMRFVRAGAAAMPPALIAQMEQTFRVPLIEAYAMTEAAALIASNRLPPHERRPGSVGRSAGPEIAILSESGALQPAGAGGEIVIRGANIFDGYLDAPDANRLAFINGWFRTGDLGRLDADGYLYVHGRIKEMINRGGQKISPHEVESALLEHPDIEQALVFAMPDARQGEEVAAAIIPRAGAAPAEAGVRQFLEGRLANFKWPRRILSLDTFPLGPTGKPQRLGLADALGLNPTNHAPPAPGRIDRQGPLEQQLTSIWKNVLEVDHVGLDDCFLEIGGDSLLAVGLLSLIEAVIGKRLPMSALIEAPTIRRMAQLLQQEGISPSPVAMVPLHRQGTRPPFFCVAGIGGHVASFYPLARHLGADQPFYGLQLPARIPGQPYPSIERMAADFIANLREVQPAGPYYIGGYSYGGMLAFEMARQLQSQREQVALVLLIDTWGPGYPRKLPMIQAIYSYCSTAIQEGFRRSVQRLLRRARRHNPWDPSPYQRDVRARRLTWQQYQPEVYAGHLTLLRAVSKSHRPGVSFADPLQGWGPLTTAGVEVHDLPGEHLSLFTPPHLATLGQTIRTCLLHA